ncbi:DUF4044 domain-containing protein [Jeotgalibaca porci]|nr:DUF4044 domain-containing protein [Jeotgalibaca porci]
MTKKTNTTSKASKFSKIIIWLMVFAMVGSMFISVLYSLFFNL